jgi:puromycin-sensitive aminopeptidase
MAATTEHRLPRDVVPSHYELVLEPDLDTARFAGTAAITVEVVSPTDEVVCNALDLEIHDAVLVSGGRTIALSATVDEAGERVTLRAPHPLPAGPASLQLRFAGTLNDKLRGFYRSTFTDDAGVTHTMATTQFEATDARRAFPCWDEPDFKASFGVTLVIDERLDAVSNGALVSDEPTGDGRRRLRFAPTMVMSTYLVAFVVGPLEFTRTVDAGGVPLRVVHRPGRAHLAELGLDVGAFCLRYFADYFDVPYPGDKVDLVSIPDFAFGAMENLGCVTFRETALLVDPATATQPELQRVVDVVAHELAHMWFGDLVTMRWWNGIWLNEAFATFMEMKATDAYRPDWQRWTDFGLSRTAAFDVDSLQSTRPIEYEVVSPADAEGMFDVLTYEKGAAVVRMLEQYLGEQRFREGIRAYMRTHAYGNTETSDLWDAIETASGEPVRRIMESWIFQRGYPVVSVTGRDERGIALAQHRFRFGTPAADDATTWFVPVRARVQGPSGEREVRLLLDGATGVLPVAADEDIVTLNVEGSGFYRVQLDGAALLRIAESGPSGLSPIERYGLVDDTVALALARRVDAPVLMAFLGGFGDEDDLSVWQRIVGALDALWRATAPTDRAPFAARIDAIVRPAHARLAGAPDLDDRGRQLRATLFGALGRLAGAPDVVAEARRIRAEGHDDPSLVAAALSVVATHATADDHAAFVRELRAATSPQDEDRLRGALTEVPGAAELNATAALVLTPDIRSQDGPYLLARAMQNRVHGDRVWRFVTDHWDDLNTRFPSNSIARMLSGIVALAEPATAAAVTEFLAAHPVPQGRTQVDQHLERLQVNVDFRQRARPLLAQALR